MAGPAPSRSVECPVCFFNFETRAPLGGRLGCPMCEGFFQLNRDHLVEGKEKPPSKETGPGAAKAATPGPVAKVEAARKGKAETTKASKAEAAPTAPDEEDLKETAGEVEAEWEVAETEPASKPTAAPSPAKAEGPAARVRRQAGPAEQWATSAATSARGLLYEVTSPYRERSLWQLARGPRTRVQLAALILVAVFFLGLLTTLAQTWKAYSWEEPLAGGGLVSLQLTVQTDDAHELEDAKVELRARKTVVETDERGKAYLPNLPPGDHTVYISLAGYNNVTLLVTLRPETDTQKTVILTAGGPDERIDDREATGMPAAEVLYLLAVFFLVGSLAAFTGASLALQRVRYRLTLGCAVLAVLSFGFLVGSLLALAALLLIILGAGEFAGRAEEAGTA